MLHSILHCVLSEYDSRGQQGQASHQHQYTFHLVLQKRLDTGNDHVTTHQQSLLVPGHHSVTAGTREWLVNNRFP